MNFNHAKFCSKSISIVVMSIALLSLLVLLFKKNSNLLQTLTQFELLSELGYLMQMYL
jgi:hypothetical protein